MDEALQVFVDESQELLREMEAALLLCQQGTADAETINAIFRSAHTIKGSSGLFGLDPVVGFVHVLETALDRVRAGTVQMGRDLVTLLIECTDHVEDLIASVAAGSGGADADLDVRSSQLSERLQELAGTVRAVRSAGADAARDSVASATGAEGLRVASACWHLSLRFKADVLRAGMDPLSIIQYLKGFGTIRGLALVEHALPPLETADPECCYLGFELALETTESRERIETAFEFVRDDCTVRMLPPHASLEEYSALLRELPEPDAGGLLVACGSLTEAEVARCAAGDSETASDATTSSASKQSAASAKRSAPREAARTVRVDAGKLDDLITLVGELIISAATANLDARRARDTQVQESTSRLSELVQEVRDRALELRMVRLEGTLSRFHRVVSDVARETGKEIGLTITGEDTELDKTVVERIADPLTHLVRNAIDHGIEPADVRRARGKPQRGTVRLNAYHDAGSVVIEVSDDGGGLKRERILARALERGLIEPGRVPGDAELQALIFEPGFSTAEQVTSLSGRGVGMDVVKRNVTALRGSISISSVEGAGTTVTIRLPLTLAIINGFLVGLGKAVFVLPLEMIEECIELSPDDAQFVSLRGRPLPLVRLRSFLGIAGERARRENVVVINCAGQKLGLVVDELLGEFQTVIKPLGRMFASLACVSGSSILGNGEVALILDVPAIAQAASSESAAEVPVSARPTREAVA